MSAPVTRSVLPGGAQPAHILSGTGPHSHRDRPTSSPGPAHILTGTGPHPHRDVGLSYVYLSVCVCVCVCVCVRVCCVCVAQTGAFCPGGASAFPFDGFYAATSEDGVVEECAPVAKLRCIGWDRASDVMVRLNPSAQPVRPVSGADVRESSAQPSPHGTR